MGAWALAGSGAVLTEAQPPGGPSQDLPCSLPTGHQRARLSHQVRAKRVSGGHCRARCPLGPPRALPAPRGPGHLLPGGCPCPPPPSSASPPPGILCSPITPRPSLPTCRRPPLPLPAPHPQGFPSEEGEGDRWWADS